MCTFSTIFLPFLGKHNCPKLELVFRINKRKWKILGYVVLTSNLTFDISIHLHNMIGGLSEDYQLSEGIVLLYSKILIL